VASARGYEPAAPTTVISIASSSLSPWSRASVRQVSKLSEADARAQELPPAAARGPAREQDLGDSPPVLVIRLHRLVIGRRPGRVSFIASFARWYA
jgi:hypothetical protein